MGASGGRRSLVRLINNFQDATEVKGFYRCTLGYFRGSKLAFVSYFTPHTLKLIERNREELDDRTASDYYSKFGYIAPKYLRKFAFDAMISEKLGSRRRDRYLIQGRVPKWVGARHYTKLLRQADGYYMKYVDYLDKIRDDVNWQSMRDVFLGFRNIVSNLFHQCFSFVSANYLKGP